MSRQVFQQRCPFDRGPAVVYSNYSLLPVRGRRVIHQWSSWGFETIQTNDIFRTCNISFSTLKIPVGGGGATGGRQAFTGGCRPHAPRGYANDLC